MLCNYARAQASVLRARGEVPREIEELNLNEGHHVGLAAALMNDPG
jgi:hypothetical protein